MQKKSFGILLMVLGLVLSAPLFSAAQEAEQIVTTVDDILKANPLKDTDKIQLLKMVQDETATVSVIRMVPDAVVKHHKHNVHSEMLYIVQGEGRLFVNGDWAEVKPGNVHFNPMGKVHALKNTGKDPLVILAAYTPAMTTPDREFMETK